jgi:hypothetical protein
MAINQDPNLPGADPTLSPRDSTMYDRDNIATTGTNTTYDADGRMTDRDGGGSNFLAFLIGGLVIAIGLLAFLFYDGSTTGRDVNTTSSTTPRLEAPATPSPAAPATPARPANPQ